MGCKGRKPKCHDEYKVCPHGFKSSGYKCVTEKVTYAAKKCAYGFEHLQGSCFKFAVYECPHQYEWSSHTNKCFKDSYGFADYICPHGYENEHGKCQKYTKVFAPGECPHGFVHNHGKKCQKFAKYECPAGYKWDGHKCALKVTKFVEKVCKGRKPKCHDEYKVCPHGFKSSGYKCVTEKVMYAAKKCPHGFFASYGKCVQERGRCAPMDTSTECVVGLLDFNPLRTQL